MLLNLAAQPYDAAWSLLMQQEGGSRVVDNPADPGGITKWGVTLQALRTFRKDPELDHTAIEGLTEAEAKQLCFTRFWRPLGLENCRNYPAGALILDQGYNRGVVIVGRQVQTQLLAVLGQAHFLMPDGLNVLAVGDPGRNRAFLVKFLVASQKSYLAMVQDKPHLAVFLNGWINRTHVLLEVILQCCP